MKILIFLTKWKGGVGTVVREIESELKKGGHGVISISREDNLKCFSSVKNLFWLREKYKEIIKKENPDIIYTQDWSMALPLLFPSKIYKQKHFCCFHGNETGVTFFMQPLIGRFMGNKIVAVGTYNKNRLPKSFLVSNGVNTEKFRPLKKKREFLGWINKETEIYSKDQLKYFAKKSGYKLKVAENIPPEKMNEEFYNKCKVFFSIPPPSAGCQLSWMEAMAAGVPKIIGNKEGDGNLLPISQISEFKGPVDAIINAKERNYRELTISGNFTWENHVDKLLRIWENEKC